MENTQKQDNTTKLEQRLLGSLLIRNSRLEEVRGTIGADYFTHPVHKRIFEAICRMVDEGRTANPITLSPFFDADDDLKESGGTRYLMRMAAHATNVIEAKDYASALADSHNLSLMVEYCQLAAERLEGNTEEPAEEIIGNLMANCDAFLSKSSVQQQGKRGISAGILEDLYADTHAFSTGYSRLDRAMDGGLHPGKVYGFAARKKVGKTILASSISHNLNAAGVKHLFICGEMSPKEIEQRNMARELNVYPSAFRNKKYQNQQFLDRVAHYCATVPDNMVYENAPGLTFDRLRRAVSTAVNNHQIQGFILDYWQLVGGKGKGKSTSEHLDEVAQWIADFSRKHKLWAVVMAQINQDGNTRGGEGMRLAFDQVYQINRKDLTQPETYLEMMDTRYTAWMDVGDEHAPGFMMNPNGPWFEQV